MIPAGGGPRRTGLRGRRVVAAILLGAVAAAGGAYAVHVVSRSAVDTPVTGHAVVSAGGGGADAPATPFSEVGPDSTLPPHPVSLGAHQLVVPILLYHYIRINRHANDRVGFNLSVTPQNFAQQMALLVASGAHTVTFADLVDALRGGPPLPPHPVILTFDDGYDDFYSNALPVLQRDHLRAVSYVVSGFVDKPGYMTSAQVRDIAAAGMIVGAHTVHHVGLAHVSLAEAAQEITLSRIALSGLIGSRVDDFAYPYGDWNPAVAKLVKAAGFRDAVTTDLGNVEDLSQLFTLRRIRIGGTDTVATFAAKAGVRVVPLPPQLVAAPGSPSPTGTPAPSPQPSPSPRPSSTGPMADRVLLERRAA